MTFRVRLTLAYLVLLGLALSGFAIWVYAYVDRNLHQEFYVSVQRQGSQLAQVLAGDYDAAANRARETLDQLTTGQGVATYIVVERRLPRGVAAGHRGQAPGGRPQRRRPSGRGARPGRQRPGGDQRPRPAPGRVRHPV